MKVEKNNELIKGLTKKPAKLSKVCECELKESVCLRVTFYGKLKLGKCWASC